MRKLLKVTFEEEGIIVVEAPGALAAWEIIHKHKINVILSDLYMADYSGLDLLRNIRGRKIRIPVILLTGRPTEEALQQARELGAVSVLAKSGDLSPVKETVFQVLENLELRPRSRGAGTA
ncbi:MAG: response regulator [Candidatus Riflebacteria bacterium]|nr:response regulator [Candidatus Riflebacteria bacterium]